MEIEVSNQDLDIELINQEKDGGAAENKQILGACAYFNVVRILELY